MKFTRRESLARAAAILPLAAHASASMPLKSEFAAAQAETCLNNARWHPISNGARLAVLEYLDYKAAGGGSRPDYAGDLQRQVKQQFAKLINAKPSEISFVPSTLAGENLVVSALGLPGIGGNIVTDALHFEGSLYMYDEFRKQGLDVRVVRPTGWRVRLGDLEKVIDKNTRLVAISLVSMMTGFQHDWKAVSELAHSVGAPVFADVVQAAGAVPLDVRASQVDFCSCASYKWLMGDMGLGFLYVREDRLERLRRPVYGYRQLADVQYHLFPYDSPGGSILDSTQLQDAGGHFEVGTVSNTTIACLSYSLPLLQRLGVENIQAYRQPLLDRLQQELPRMGFEPLTPEGTRSPIVAFAVKDTKGIAQRLQHARVDVSVTAHRIRISPSVYNDQRDIDRLLECLKGA